jgi:hypothetical protein
VLSATAAAPAREVRHMQGALHARALGSYMGNHASKARDDGEGGRFEPRTPGHQSDNTARTFCSTRHFFRHSRGAHDSCYRYCKVSLLRASYLVSIL